MRSLFHYSRLVYRGGPEWQDKVVEAAKTAGEKVGEAANTAITWGQKLELLKAGKISLEKLWEGFNDKFYHQENQPTDAEKTQRLIRFVAEQIGVTELQLRDALYTELTQDSNPARRQKRHDILKNIVVMQGYLPEIELYFVGVTQRLDRSQANGAERDGTVRDRAWYMKRKNALQDILGVRKNYDSQEYIVDRNAYEIAPYDVRAKLYKHREAVEEYLNSATPDIVAAKYPKLFLTGDPNFHGSATFLDFALAYENARAYVQTLHNDPVVRNSGRNVPAARKFQLYVFEIPQTRLHGVMMKHSDAEMSRGVAGGGARPSGGPSGGPSAGPSAVAGGAGGEKAPDGKEGERLDPVADLDAFAKKNKWKGVQRDPKASLVPFAKDIPLVRDTSLAKSDPYDYAHLAKHIAPLERALKDISSNAKYREFWPLLPEVMVTITPNHVADINMFAEGFSWSDETLKIDYNESEEDIREDLLAGLKEYNAYKKLGGKETSSEKAERLELARQMELYIKNYDLLFTKNDTDKNAWKNNLAEAKDPARFAVRIESNPSYIQEQLAAIRKSVREAYVWKTWQYVDQFDAKIGAGMKDGSNHGKENWKTYYDSIKVNTTNPDLQNIEVVVPMVRFFKSNLEGKPVPMPGAPSSGGEAGKEKSPEAGVERGRAEQALVSIARATGYPLSMLPTRVRDNIYTYDYAEITGNATAIQQAIKDLSASETPERQAILKNIGLSPTPKRTLNYKWRQEGLVKLPDGGKRILFKVSDDADEMAAAISKGIDEIQKESSRSAKEAEKDRPPELPKEALRAKITSKVKDIAAWYALSPEDREDDNFAETGMTLEKIAKVFGVSGDPATEDYAYRRLGNEIYGIVPSPEKSGDAPSLRVSKMLVAMSDKYGFNIRLQPGVEYNYGDILNSRNKFASAFSGVKPSTKAVLARAGVVLGEIGMSGDQEGVIKTSDGRYRIAIDWNEDAGEIITQLDTYANEYEDKVKDLREDDIDDMSDLQVKAENDKKLKKILDPYKVKYVYEDGFDDHKDLSGHIDAIKRAFDGLSGADKTILKQGEYQIVISNGATEEGLISNHTILIDYDDGVEAIKEDLSNGIEEQENKQNIFKRVWKDSTGWLKKKLKFW